MHDAVHANGADGALSQKRTCPVALSTAAVFSTACNEANSFFAKFVGVLARLTRVKGSAFLVSLPDPCKR